MTPSPVRKPNHLSRNQMDLKLKVAQTDKSGEIVDAQTIEVESGAHLTLDFALGIQITREGEQPARVAPVGEDLVIQWEDGSYVVLEAAKGTFEPDETDEPRVVSINGMTISGFGGDLDEVQLDPSMQWTASYMDSPLPWAPLPPYQVLFPEEYELEALPEEEEPGVPEPPVPPVDENLPPVIGSAEGALSEEGLPGGIPDTIGNPDTTDATVLRGKLSVSDRDGDRLVLTLNAPEVPPITGTLAVRV